MPESSSLSRTNPAPPTAPGLRSPVSFGIDLLVVLTFVAIGRSAHDEAILGLLGTAAPFVIALLLAWGVVLGLRQRPDAIRAGVVVWGITWVTGLALRAIVFGGGTAVPFIIVAGVSLAVGLIGWRMIRVVVQRRSR